MAEPRDVSILIPAFNEAGAIANVIRDLLASGAWREVLVIDDGSTDGTADQAASAGARAPAAPSDSA